MFNMVSKYTCHIFKHFLYFCLAELQSYIEHIADGDFFLVEMYEDEFKEENESDDSFSDLYPGLKLFSQIVFSQFSFWQLKN